MKKGILLLCLIFAVLVVGCGKEPADAQPQKSETSIASSEALAGNHVVAYYFHGNYRCASCIRIEQYSKEAIEKYFADEIKAGRLEYRVVNVEEKQNEHYIKDYKLYTKSLVLSLVNDGKEVKSENLAKVWELLGNREAFYDYVKTNVSGYLGELPK